MLLLVSAYNGGTLRSKFRNLPGVHSRNAPEPERVFVRAIPWEVMQNAFSESSENSSSAAYDPVTTEGAFALNEMAMRHQTPTPLLLKRGWRYSLQLLVTGGNCAMSALPIPVLQQGPRVGLLAH